MVVQADPRLYKMHVIIYCATHYELHLLRITLYLNKSVTVLSILVTWNLTSHGLNDFVRLADAKDNFQHLRSLLNEAVKTLNLVNLDTVNSDILSSNNI